MSFIKFFFNEDKIKIKKDQQKIHNTAHITWGQENEPAIRKKLHSFKDMHY